MKDLNMVFAGFGGQGVLFAGKVVAYAGLIEGRELSWLPSYGPEMRGGTANCSVCLSDEAIGSPLVTNPNVLVAMNRPSLEKFVNEVEPGGVILLDSSLIDVQVERDDVTTYYVPASTLAEENGLKGLANIILVGKLFKEVGFCSEETLDKALQKCIPARKASMLDFNRKAIEIGRAVNSRILIEMKPAQLCAGFLHGISAIRQRADCAQTMGRFGCSRSRNTARGGSSAAGLSPFSLQRACLQFPHILFITPSEYVFKM